MYGMQEIFDKCLHENLKLNVIGPKVLERKLEKIGIKITGFQREDFKVQFSDPDFKVLNFDFSEEQIYGAGFSSESDLALKVTEIVKDLTESIIEVVDNFINEGIDDFIQNIVSDISKSVKNNLYKNIDEMFNNRSQISSDYISEINNIWGDALQLLQACIAIYDEATLSFVKTHIKEKEYNVTLDVLLKLNARASQTTKEILSLLQNGFADGALARWRSLHEISVISLFIKEHGDKVALMYLEHEGIHSYKAAIQFNEYRTRLGYAPVDDKEVGELFVNYNDLLEKYGKNYKYPYGWATEAINLSKPNFYDIECSIELDHLRPFYKFASNNVHANSKGMLFRLGLYPDDDALLAGASYIGLSEPAKLTVISFNQILTSLLMNIESIDTIIICQIMMDFCGDVEKEFSLIEAKLAKKFNKEE